MSVRFPKGRNVFWFQVWCGVFVTGALGSRHLVPVAALQINVHNYTGESHVACR